MTTRRGRPRYEDILTPREWQVLDLIEGGLTNEAIAERLGISFGTVKYHVAEIISKLGVTTREEAVVAARRARAPAAPAWSLAWLRPRFGLPMLGGTVVVAAVLLISVAVFTDVLRGASSPASEGDRSDAAADFQAGDAAAQTDVLTRAPAELSSFYYELTVTSREPQAPAGQAPNTNARVRLWYRAPDQWRSEYFDATTAEPSAIHVTDGTTEWHYGVADQTYHQEPDDGVLPRPLMGPLAGGSIDGYMADERDGPAHYWEVEGGADAVLGIDTVRIAQVCCREGPVDQRISEQRFWIDPTYNFLLRIEEKSPATGGVTLYEVTDVEYNPDLDDGLFIFDPPPGTKEAPPP